MPFAIGSASQFRPPPPVPLKSKQWAAAYNEIKEYGGKTSDKRSASQTDTARFWLMGGPPAYQQFGREIARAANMSVVDAARFMALYSVALSDAFIAVLDAKYRYKLWRPVTAIRNRDLDDNPATQRDPTWQPLEATPMHPEYPCGHCIAAGTGAAVAESVLGTSTIPEVAVTSTTLPGVTHRWTSTKAYADEVSEARVWAGFHYRFSIEVGRDMGEKIGRHVVGSVMQPVK